MGFENVAIQKRNLSFDICSDGCAVCYDFVAKYCCKNDFNTSKIYFFIRNLSYEIYLPTVALISMPSKGSTDSSLKTKIFHDRQNFFFELLVGKRRQTRRRRVEYVILF